MLDAPPEKTVTKLKEDILSALTSKVLNANGEPGVPTVETLNDFEICRELKEREGKTLMSTGKFEALDESETVVKQTSPYENLFLRFRINGVFSSSILEWLYADARAGVRQKVEYTIPPKEEPEDMPEPEPVSPSKGKRRAID